MVKGMWLCEIDGLAAVGDIVLWCWRWLKGYAESKIAVVVLVECGEFWCGEWWLKVLADLR